MIQEEMVFALGFLTAGLLALLCLPAIWRRALRLTSRRLEQLVPLSADEIAAERDQLRAGFAVDQRRLEQKLERSEAGRAEALSETGRRTARIAALDAEIARVTVEAAALTAELDALRRTLAALQAENGAFVIALHDATERAERYSREKADLEERNRTLDSLVDEHRAAIAALETRKVGLETRGEDLLLTLDAAKADRNRLAEALHRVEGERDAAREAAQTMAGKRDDVARNLSEMASQLATAKADLVRQVERAAELDSRLAVEAKATEAARAALEELRRRVDEVEGRHAAHIEAIRTEDRRRAVQIEELRAEKTALANALAAARADGQKANTGQPVSNVRDEVGELSTLREAIRKVADDVLRIAARAAETGLSPEGGAKQGRAAEGGTQVGGAEAAKTVSAPLAPPP